MSQANNGRLRKIGAWTVGFLLLLTGIAAAVVTGRLRDKSVRERVIEALSVRLKAEVTLDSLEVDLFPRIRIVGQGLTIRRVVDAPSHPPIIVVDSFIVHPGLRRILQGRAESVEVTGMRVTVPRPIGAVTTTPSPPPPQAPAPRTTPSRPPIISRLVARHAELVYISRRPDGPVRVFQIHEVDLHDVSFDHPMPFAAHLTNPLPRGEVRSTGQFGPFDPDEPGHSAIEGSYDFSESDFGTLKGVSGNVTSKGIFAGILDEVQVDGTTDSDNFQLDDGGNPTALTTRFRAVVDATTGDLRILHLDGRLADSAFTATGSIARDERPTGRGGRYVSLDIAFGPARIEDLLGFMHEAARPLMRGDVTLKGTVLLPTGEGRALDRLEVTGTIGVEHARFSSRAMQARLQDLSRRAQGLQPGAAEAGAVIGLTGRFRIQNSHARFRTLQFRTQGARVSLNGSYGLRDTSIDFTGTARLEASMSQAVGGVRGFLLKPLDPIFRKQGAGTVLPIRMVGTLKEPKTSVQIRKIFRK